jgi:hypothetical protein
VIAATAITNVRVFDGERLREPATVVLEETTISARTSADGTLNADIADGAGGTLCRAEQVAEGSDYIKILVTAPAWSCAADAIGCICCCASGLRAAAALGGLPGRRAV